VPASIHLDQPKGLFFGAALRWNAEGITWEERRPTILNVPHAQGQRVSRTFFLSRNFNSMHIIQRCWMDRSPESKLNASASPPSALDTMRIHFSPTHLPFCIFLPSCNTPSLLLYFVRDNIIRPRGSMAWLSTSEKPSLTIVDLSFSVCSMFDGSTLKCVDHVIMYHSATCFY
jgi:hypothetical protein